MHRKICECWNKRKKNSYSKNTKSYYILLSWSIAFAISSRWAQRVNIRVYTICNVFVPGIIHINIRMDPNIVFLIEYPTKKQNVYSNRGRSKWLHLFSFFIYSCFPDLFSCSSWIHTQRRYIFQMRGMNASHMPNYHAHKISSGSLAKLHLILWDITGHHADYGEVHVRSWKFPLPLFLSIKQ